MGVGSANQSCEIGNWFNSHVKGKEGRMDEKRKQEGWMVEKRGWMDEKNSQEGWMAEKNKLGDSQMEKISQKKAGWMAEKSPSKGPHGRLRSSTSEVSRRYGLPVSTGAPPKTPFKAHCWLLLLVLCCSWPCGQAVSLDSNRTGPPWASSGLGRGTVLPCALTGSAGCSATAAAVAAAFAPWQLYGSWMHAGAQAGFWSLTFLLIGCWSWGFLFPDRMFGRCRKCSSGRLKAARFGWRKRLLVRCFGCPFEPASRCQSPETLLKGVSNGGNTKGWVGKLVKRCRFSHSKSCASHMREKEVFEINPHCFIDGACSGGAGGSNTTARKRAERNSVESQLLAGLADLLKKFEPKVSRPSRTEKETENTIMVRERVAPSLDWGLLNALHRLVTRAEKKPEGLLGRLKNLLHAAENAAKSGQSVNPGSTKTKVPNQTERDSSKEIPKGTNKGKTKGKMGGDQGKPIEESPWITVGRGGRPVGKEKGKGNKGIRPIIFRLREQDWTNTVVVQSAGMFGSMVDKKGTDSPFVVMVLNPDELKVVLGTIHGDKTLGFRLSVLAGPMKMWYVMRFLR